VRNIIASPEGVHYTPPRALQRLASRSSQPPCPRLTQKAAAEAPVHLPEARALVSCSPQRAVRNLLAPHAERLRTEPRAARRHAARSNRSWQKEPNAARICASSSPRNRLSFGSQSRRLFRGMPEDLAISLLLYSSCG